MAETALTEAIISIVLEGTEPFRSSVKLFRRSIQENTVSMTFYAVLITSKSVITFQHKAIYISLTIVKQRGSFLKYG